MSKKTAAKKKVAGKKKTAKKPSKKLVEALRHAEANRKNIPTPEVESVMTAADKSPTCLAYERRNRNRDLDPQIVWRGRVRIAKPGPDMQEIHNASHRRPKCPKR